MLTRWRQVWCVCSATGNLFTKLDLSTAFHLSNKRWVPFVKCKPIRPTQIVICWPHNLLTVYVLDIWHFMKVTLLPSLCSTDKSFYTVVLCEDSSKPLLAMGNFTPNSNFLLTCFSSVTNHKLMDHTDGHSADGQNTCSYIKRYLFRTSLATEQ